MRAYYKEHREKSVEYIAEHDDSLVEKYLNGEKISADELRASIRRSTIALKLVPVLAGSAFKNKGIQPLLDAVVDYLPSPLDVPPVEGTTPDDEVVLRRASDDEPFSALAFKIMSDPFVGHVTYIRVYSGVLKAGSYVYNSTKSTRERVGRLLRMHANKREEIDAIYAGDIAACVGLKSVTTGDTLCDEEKAVVLENIEFPAPVISVAIEPKTKADQDKLGNAMQRLAQEDPTFRVHCDPDTGQTIISGMGELHLEIIVDRMMREFGVQATVGRPQVAYRETIRKKAQAEGKYIRRPAAAVSTATAKSKCFRCLPPRTKTCMKCRPMSWTCWPRKSAARAASGALTKSTACCSSTRRWAARFPRNLSLRLMRAFAKPWKTAFWPATKWWTSPFF